MTEMDLNLGIKDQDRPKNEGEEDRSLLSDDMTEKNKIIIRAAEDKLGRDINILPIREEAGIADYFIIISGRNKNHTHAIADEIDKKLTEAGNPPDKTEGLREGSWILLDCGDTIVHIFTQAERDFYELDKLWSD